MKLDNEQLKKLLLEANLMSNEDFDKASKEAAAKKLELLEYLPQTSLISDEQLGWLIANHLKCQFVNLRKEKIDENVVRLIPELVAKTQQIIAFDQDEEGVKVAMSDPTDLEMLRLLKKRLGDNITVYCATPADIKEVLKYYKRSMGQDFVGFITEQSKAAASGKAEDETVIKMVDELIEYGIDNHASDIHIEPLDKNTAIRFRIDGVMHKVVTLPKDVHDIIVTRIKVLAKLRIDEHQAAQDGKLQYKTGKGKVDLRVSVAPISEGEKVVMRILSTEARQFRLEDLGLEKSDLKKVKRNMRKAWGMILATGPTGSGKTTTLYSILKILNTEKVNIATIEDPVEYDMEGINQIQVNTKKKITFASGLRTIVRQDPDIIMVGEIRDKETAAIAINSAMTGHLVLSTLHTNDAATAFPRLEDMGVEPFLVASSVNAVIAQRLVRAVCERCRKSYIIKHSDLKDKMSDDELALFSKGKDHIKAYHGLGCKVCAGTGYKGRIGIFETLEVTDKIKELIMSRANADRILRLAVEEGMSSMFEDGVSKVLAGVTTVEEILRVIKEK